MLDFRLYLFDNDTGLIIDLVSACIAFLGNDYSFPFLAEKTYYTNALVYWYTVFDIKTHTEFGVNYTGYCYRFDSA